MIPVGLAGTQVGLLAEFKKLRHLADMGSSPLSSRRLSPVRLASCLALFLALAATAAAQAPVDELLLARSSVVVFGEVLSAGMASSGDRPAADSLLEVGDVLKGQVAGSRIVVRSAGGFGGRVGGERLTLAEGDRVLLFLEAEENGAYAIAEYPLGMFWEARMGGRSLLLGWGAAAAARSQAVGDGWLLPRDAVRFRRWIADRVSGAEPPAAYFTTSRTEAPVGARSASTAPCTPTSDVFEFDGGYRVRLCYATAAGDVGQGRSGIWASGQGGLFWFFDRGNPEALIKILDGCDINQHRWVFFAPVSDLGLHLEVTSPNEETWTYTNPVGKTAPAAADTAAFPCGDEPEEEPPPDGPPDGPDIECEDQRSLALGHEAYFGGRGVVREWDGSPIRVDIVRNFPGFVTDADLGGLLEPVRRLADQIEARLGYRIIEVGGVIDVPPGAPPGWDQDFNRFFESWRVRERGQVIAFYMNDDNPQDWDGRGGSIMSAHACCGTTSYNKRALGAWWNDGDPCCRGNANGRDGAVLVHELFHLLGFKHAYDQFELTGVAMSRGGLDRPWVTGSRVFYATNGDVDNLACVFPEGG